jgi:N-acetylmuramate 1-kinase
MNASWTIENLDLTQLDRLASRLAIMLRPQDVLTLSGPLGAGKTTFARALIQRLTGESEVPSPTFAIMQKYEAARFGIVHADFYRLQPGELGELGLDDALDTGLVIIEWPERAEESLPPDRLDMALEETADPNRRRAILTGKDSWAPRLERLRALCAFVEGTPYADAVALYLQGDASPRAYSRLLLPERSAILMNAPRQPDGPPIRDGKPYSALVHLAEDVTPFVALSKALRDCGVTAPAVFAYDLEQGFLLIEDFGDQVFGAELAAGGDMAPLYEAAVDTLLALGNEPPPDVIEIDADATYRLPHYDAEALLTEASLVIDWFWPAMHGRTVPETLRREFLGLWRPHLEGVASADQGWVLRDYHSPNIMWLPERDGPTRVGVLDFQDALIGPKAYDLVSLLQDARLDVPEALEARLLDRYCSARAAQEPQFSGEIFRSLYATLGAQRNSKILGIFARLAKRDGKRGYLAHIPRVMRYLERDLSHPALADLRAWYAREFPSGAEMPALSL